MSELVCVRSYAFRPEADLARSVLDAAGIESVIVADDASGMRPLGGLMNRGVMLCVLEEDAARADAALAEGEPADRRDGR
jgi:hypothetical protein